MFLCEHEPVDASSCSVQIGEGVAYAHAYLFAPQKDATESALEESLPAT
jgi:hypothetical protein